MYNLQNTPVYFEPLQITTSKTTSFMQNECLKNSKSSALTSHLHVINVDVGARTDFILFYLRQYRTKKKY